MESQAHTRWAVFMGRVRAKSRLLALILGALVATALGLVTNAYFKWWDPVVVGVERFFSALAVRAIGEGLLALLVVGCAGAAILIVVAFVETSPWDSR